VNENNNHVPRPVGEHILVRRWEAKKTTEGGLELPDKSVEVLNKGRVVALSSKLVEPEVRVGDVVQFARHSGTEVTANDGKVYLCLHVDDVLAVL